MMRILRAALCGHKSETVYKVREGSVTCEGLDVCCGNCGEVLESKPLDCR